MYSAVIMLVVGLFGKLSALLVSLPEPIVGGVFTIMFGLYILINYDYIWTQCCCLMDSTLSYAARACVSCHYLLLSSIHVFLLNFRPIILFFFRIAWSSLFEMQGISKCASYFQGAARAVPLLKVGRPVWYLCRPGRLTFRTHAAFCRCCAAHTSHVIE